MAQSKQLTRLEPWHHDLIDWWIANPRASGREAAARFGVSAVWISLVKKSSIFQAEFRRRRERLSRGVDVQIRERATAAEHAGPDGTICADAASMGAIFGGGGRAGRACVGHSARPQIVLKIASKSISPS